MLEAIDILKGVGFSHILSYFTPLIYSLTFQVLAFEEVPNTRASSTPGDEDHPDASFLHSRSQFYPLVSEQKGSITVQTKRGRAPSDPFLDTPSRSVGSSSIKRTSLLVSDNSEEPLSPVLSPTEETGRPREEPPCDDSEEEYMRIWTSPDLSNLEYLNLVKVFPSHITRRTLPYFSTSKSPSDLEAGLDDAVEGKQVHCGTGTLRISSMQRSDGWDGGWWVRFVLWFKGSFGFFRPCCLFS